MHELIASYLVQKKECILPGIGTLSLASQSALLDIANKEFIAPKDEIQFVPGDPHVENEFVNYVAMRYHIPAEDAAGEVYKWCLDAKEKLEKGKPVDVGYAGTFTMNEEGNILLNNDKQFSLFNNVNAERVVHQNQQHSVLVGDKETTNEEMNHFYESSGMPLNIKEKWKFNALVLAGLAIILLLFYFIFNGFSKNGIGNNLKVTPQESHTLYESSP